MTWYVAVLGGCGAALLLPLLVCGVFFLCSLRMRPDETALELATSWRTLLGGLAEVLRARRRLFLRRRTKP